MNYCRHCGKMVYPDAVVCVYCGRSLTAVNQQDTGSIGWAFLGFFVPLAGLVLYLIWKKERPRDAKRAGIGALVSVVLGIVSYIAIFILMVSIVSAFY